MASDFVLLSEALAQPRQSVKRGREIKIYALYDVRDGRVRYVGRTSKTLPRRLAEHVQHPTNDSMGGWLARGTAEAAVLEYVSDDEWEAAERGWIHWFRQRGELLNVDPGGVHRDDRGAVRGDFVGHYLPPGRKEAMDMRRLLMQGGHSNNLAPIGGASPVKIPAQNSAGRSTRKGPVAGQRGTALHHREPVVRRIDAHVYVRSRSGSMGSGGPAHCVVAPK